jgi:hypothetical protein
MSHFTRADAIVVCLIVVAVGIVTVVLTWGRKR